MSDHGRMVVVVVGRGSSRFPIGSVRVAGTDHQVGGRVVDVGDTIVAQHQRRRHQRNTSGTRHDIDSRNSGSVEVESARVLDLNVVDAALDSEDVTAGRHQFAFGNPPM